MAIYFTGHFWKRLKIIASFTKIDILHSWPLIFMNGLNMKHSFCNYSLGDGLVRTLLTDMFLTIIWRRRWRHTWLLKKSHSRWFKNIFYARNVFAIALIDEQPGTIIYMIHIPSKFCCAGLRTVKFSHPKRQTWVKTSHSTLASFHPILLCTVTKLWNTQRLLSPQPLHNAFHYHTDYIHIYGISR